MRKRTYSIKLKSNLIFTIVAFGMNSNVNVLYELFYMNVLAHILNTNKNTFHMMNLFI